MESNRRLISWWPSSPKSAVRSDLNIGGEPAKVSAKDAWVYVPAIPALQWLLIQRNVYRAEYRSLGPPACQAFGVLGKLQRICRIRELGRSGVQPNTRFGKNPVNSGKSKRGQIGYRRISTGISSRSFAMWASIALERFSRTSVSLISD